MTKERLLREGKWISGVLLVLVAVVMGWNSRFAYDPLWLACFGLGTYFLGPQKNSRASAASARLEETTMKRTLRVFGWIFASIGMLTTLGIVIFLALMPLMMRQAEGIAESGVGYAQASIAIILDSWNEHELIERSDEAFINEAQKRGTGNILLPVKAMVGDIKLLKECSPGSSQFTNGEGWIEISCTADFQNGRATVWMLLSGKRDVWTITNFEIRLPTAY
jgi:hypothetical protein